MKKIFLLLLLCSLSYVSLSQEKNEKELIQFFLENNDYLHSQLKEKFFLHTNKTTYFSGEKVWFKGYIVKDIDNKPYNTTTNLYVNLLSSTGNQIKSNLFFVERGKVYGEIKLPENIKSGEYFIEINTLWNTNFEQTGSLTKISVVNLKDQNYVKKVEKEVKEELNIQFFPEGGNLLKNTHNIVYFKIKLGNEPVKTKLYVFDNEIGENIGEFQSDSFGLGKLKLYVGSNQNKSIKLNYREKEYRFNLPEAKDYGFTIEKEEDKISNGFVVLRVKTNSNTLKRDKGQIFYAVLQRNGFVISVIPIKLEEKYESYKIKYGKEVLFDGVNTVTLFDSKNRTIAEQTFFYEKEKKIKVSASVIKETVDSIYLGLKLLNFYKKVNTSASILSSETRVNENNQNILTDFLVSPYIKYVGADINNVFNKDYSNEDVNRIIKTIPLRKSKALSLSKKKSFEQGINIKGNINIVLSNNENYSVLLSSEENSLILTEEVGKDGNFSFKNLYLIHPSKYELSLLDSKGKIIPCTFNIHKEQGYINSKIEVREKNKKVVFKTTKKAEVNSTVKEHFLVKRDDFTELEEVVVKGKRIKSGEAEVRAENKFIGGDFVRTVKIENERLTPFNSIADIVNTLSGVTYVKRSNQVVFHGRGPNTILGSIKALVIIDGIVITDHSVLEDLNASSLDGRIKVNKAGAGFGSRGANGVLIIKTKENKNKEKTKVELGAKRDVKYYDTDFGYTTPTKVYEKELISYMSASSERFYGTIDWIPNLDLNPNTLNILKIEKTSNNSIKLIINGFSEDGRLVSEVFDIILPKLK
ncbi:hypothetical protein [Tenacibaculum aestuarii]|uniref:hypothetical protein n=1 Tax=Tenacibaculum aestuarii TaxID=362781 RepID=UPI00389434A6